MGFTLLFIKELKSQNYIVIISGTSLGGFWANVMSEKYNIPCVIANPSLTPSKTLQRNVGVIKNYVTNDEVEFTLENALAFGKYEVTTNKSEKYVLLGMKDELLDYNIASEVFKNKKVVLDPDEKHQIKDANKIIDLIDFAIHNYYI